jgi:hypothetical protein
VVFDGHWRLICLLNAKEKAEETENQSPQIPLHKRGKNSYAAEEKSQEGAHDGNDVSAPSPGTLYGSDADKPADADRKKRKIPAEKIDYGKPGDQSRYTRQETRAKPPKTCLTPIASVWAGIGGA